MSREYLDEFLNGRKRGGRFRDSGQGRKFGIKMVELIDRCVAQLYTKFKDSIPADGPQEADECAAQFYVDCHATLERRMDDPSSQDDAAVEKYVYMLAKGWFLHQFAKTDDGKARDAIRKRMDRDARFTNKFAGAAGSACNKKSGKSRAATSSTKKMDKVSRWGLVGGPITPSIATESELKAVASQYPIDMDPDDGRDRQRAQNYGRKGQLEDMLAGVLESAQGTLELTVLFHIAQYQLAAMQSAAIDSLDKTIPGTDKPRDFASNDVPVEDQALVDSQDWTRDQISRYILERIQGHELDHKWARAYIRQHDEIRDLLMRLNDETTVNSDWMEALR